MQRVYLAIVFLVQQVRLVRH